MRVRATAQLLEWMPDVAEHGATPWARKFATSVLRQSLRAGWSPSEKQRRMMEIAIKSLPSDCDGLEVIDYDDDPALWDADDTDTTGTQAA